MSDLEGCCQVRAIAWPSPGSSRVLGCSRCLGAAERRKGLQPWRGNSLGEAAAHGLGTVLAPNVQRVRKLQASSIGVMLRGPPVQISGLTLKPAGVTWVDVCSHACAASHMTLHMSLACSMHPISTLYCTLSGVVARTLQIATKQSSLLERKLAAQPTSSGLANCFAAACYATLLLLLPRSVDESSI